MKTYAKIINGKQVVKPANTIIIIKDELQIINPNDEMLIADGWEEYVIPKPTDEEIFHEAKFNLLKQIEEYDASNDVNIFYINDTKMWLDKVTRNGLMLRFQAEKNMGMDETSLWYDGTSYTLLIDSAVQMLYALEVYASACYDNTQRHLSNVERFETIEELISYDYKEGYPEILRF
jgi:hypothetical protein